MSEQGADIAIVEDDDEIRDLVTALLTREGWRCHPCRTAVEFDALVARQAIDMAVLDIMLPGEDGLSICRRLRAQGSLPMLILSARQDDVDRIVGLEIGADDYLPKPFNPRELVARIRALLRRSRAHATPAPTVALTATVIATPRYHFDGWQWDADGRMLTAPDGTEVELTTGEHDMLLCLVEHPQRTLSRDQLLDWTRGRSAMPFDRTIDVQVGRLRRKLSAHDGGDRLIRTIRGGGYLFASPVRKQA